MPRGTTVGTDSFDDLIGFGGWNARVVATGHHHHRLGNFIDAGQRRYRQKLCPLFGYALVAVFDPAQIAAITLRVFKEGNEVGNRHHTIRAAQFGGILDGGSIAHIAAIRTAGYRDPRRVDALVLGQRVDKRTHILDRILAFERTVVQTDEFLAVAGRAAHIGIENGNAKLVQQIVAAALKARTALSFGAAVDIDDQRPFPRKSGCIRPIQESRNL